MAKKVTKKKVAAKKKVAPKAELAAIPVQRIEKSIVLVRGHRVMLDADLAELYGVATGHLNRAVKRNLDRFPDDFMFQLTEAEAEENLRCQNGISSSRYGGRRYRPFAFTEQGVAMLSSVLRSERAVAVNIEIVRAFVRLRRFLVANPQLARKVAGLEQASRRHDAELKAVFSVIRRMMAPSSATSKRRIGFNAKEDDDSKSK